MQTYKKKLLSHNLQALPGTSEPHQSDDPLLCACLCCVLPQSASFTMCEAHLVTVCLPTTVLLHACCASSITGTIMLELYIYIYASNIHKEIENT